MQDMISKIVEMDEKARELNDEALKSKIDYEQEIAVAKQTIIKDYLERARKRVQINAQSERDAAKRNSLKLVRLTPKSKKSLMTSTAQIVTAGLTKSSRE